MATYFNQNDLDARRQKTSCWIATEAIKIADILKYTGKIDPCRLTNLSYVVAAAEAVECYTPITAASEDGEDNCLTEAEAESLFTNISKITKLCFLPKGATYNTLEDDDNNQFQTVTDTSGNAVTDKGGNTLELQYTQKEFLKL